MSEAPHWNLPFSNRNQQDGGPQQGGLARSNDLTAQAFANRAPDAIVVFDLMGMVSSLVVKTPFFQQRLAQITPGTHYMLVLLQLGFTAQQMDILTTKGEFYGTPNHPAARILQQPHLGGGVMMLFNPGELNEVSTNNSEDQSALGKQSYLNASGAGNTTVAKAGTDPSANTPSAWANSYNGGRPSYYSQNKSGGAPQERQAEQPALSSRQSAWASQSFTRHQNVPPVVPNQAKQPDYGPGTSNFGQDHHNTHGYTPPGAPWAGKRGQQNSEPRPVDGAETTTSSDKAAILEQNIQELIDAAVNKALADQAAKLQLKKEPAFPKEPESVLPAGPEVQVPPIAPAMPFGYAQAAIAQDTIETIDEPVIVEEVRQAAQPSVHSFAISDDLPNSFIIHPVGANAAGHFVWQHRNNDLQIIAYGVCIRKNPQANLEEAVNIIQHALHTVVVQMGNAEADDIMIGVNNVFQSKLSLASDQTKATYCEVSLLVLNHKQRIVDMAGAPYGSFFLRNNNVSGIYNGRIAALASQMKVNNQDLRCARFRMDELNAVYLFSVGSITKSADSATASKTHNQVSQMLESVMKKSITEQYESLKHHLGMLSGHESVLPILIGVKLSN